MYKPSCIWGLTVAALLLGGTTSPLHAAKARDLKKVDKLDKVEKKEAKVAVSEETVAYLKKNYNTLITRAKIIKEKKEEFEAFSKTVPATPPVRRNVQNDYLYVEWSNKVRRQENMKQDLEKRIARWKKDYANDIAELEEAKEKEAKSLAELLAKIDKFKDEKRTSDVQFYEKMIPACEASVKKAQANLEALLAIPNVVVEMP